MKRCIKHRIGEPLLMLNDATSQRYKSRDTIDKNERRTGHMVISNIESVSACAHAKS